MRAYYLNMLLLTFFYSSTSCSNPSNNVNMKQNHNQNASDKISEMKSNQEKAKLKYFGSVDKSIGLVDSYIPLPANWNKSNKEGFLYEGPNNIRVSIAEIYFAFSIHKQSGIAVEMADNRGFKMCHPCRWSK